MMKNESDEHIDKRLKFLAHNSSSYEDKTRDMPLPDDDSDT